MNLVEKIKSLIDKSEIGLDDFDQIKDDELFNLTKDQIVNTINSYLEIPILNALKAAISIPDKNYEKNLLSYDDKQLPDEQKIYWMFALGEISSKKGYERIKKYAETGLFHQAFISMGQIDIKKTLVLFEDFLNSHLHLYAEDNKTKNHDSGYNTLVELMKIHRNPDRIVETYNYSGKPIKRELVLTALKEVKDEQY